MSPETATNGTETALRATRTLSPESATGNATPSPQNGTRPEESK